jgi:hypothetical protein
VLVRGCISFTLSSEDHSVLVNLDCSEPVQTASVFHLSLAKEMKGRLLKGWPTNKPTAVNCVCVSVRNTRRLAFTVNHGRDYRPLKRLYFVDLTSLSSSCWHRLKSAFDRLEPQSWLRELDWNASFVSYLIDPTFGVSGEANHSWLVWKDQRIEFATVFAGKQWHWARESSTENVEVFLVSSGSPQDECASAPTCPFPLRGLSQRHTSRLIIFFSHHIILQLNNFPQNSDCLSFWW